MGLISSEQFAFRNLVRNIISLPQIELSIISRSRNVSETSLVDKPNQ